MSEGAGPENTGPENTGGEARSLIVTGGSSGIGAALCRIAARAGWKVWLGYASGEGRANRLAERLTAQGGDVTAVPLPLDDTERLRKTVAAITAGGEPLPEAAVLAGSPPPDVASLLKLTPDHFRRQLECMVVGHHTLLAELWRRCFRPRGGGHVLAILSAAQGPATTPHMSSYVAAKGGFESLLRACAAEWGPGGLRISVVRPGFVDTPMLSAFAPLLVDRALSSMPGNRLLAPEEVALAVFETLQAPPRRLPRPLDVSEIPLDLRRKAS